MQSQLRCAQKHFNIYSQQYYRQTHRGQGLAFSQSPSHPYFRDNKPISPDINKTRRKPIHTKVHEHKSHTKIAGKALPPRCCRATRLKKLTWPRVKTVYGLIKTTLSNCFSSPVHNNCLLFMFCGVAMFCLCCPYLPCTRIRRFTAKQKKGDLYKPTADCQCTMLACRSIKS